MVKNTYLLLGRWHTPLITVLQRERQVAVSVQLGLHTEFQASEGYIKTLYKKTWSTC